MKLWKRVCAETTTEINLLADNWKYILTGLILQVLIQFDCYYYLTQLSSSSMNLMLQFLGPVACLILRTVKKGNDLVKHCSRRLPRPTLREDLYS